jgi:hypothetical protein
MTRRVRDHRRSISQATKRAVLLRQCPVIWVHDEPSFDGLFAEAACSHCGASLVDRKSTRFDHRPPLEARPLNAIESDFEPPQDDPRYIDAVHSSCHDQRTFGRKPGAAKTVTTVGSDAHVAAKVRRANERWAGGPAKPKRKIPSRPMRRK